MLAVKDDDIADGAMALIPARTFLRDVAVTIFSMLGIMLLLRHC